MNLLRYAAVSGVLSLCLLSCKKTFLPEEETKLPKQENTLQDAELREGYFFDQKIQYQRTKDGKNLIGEIRFPDNWITQTSVTRPDESMQGLVTLHYPINTWTNFTIPYEIDVFLTNPSRITDAITDWINHVNISFIPRTTQTDYIIFHEATPSNSLIGNHGGAQGVDISHADNTADVKRILGQIIGVWPEHVRSDNFNYLAWHWANLLPGYSIFFPTLSSGDGANRGPFDYQSIMMIPPTKWSIDLVTPLYTLTLPNGTPYTPNNGNLSPQDMDLSAYYIGFTDWQNLGGSLTSEPVATSRASNIIDVFGRGTSGQLMHKYWDGSVWSAWEDLGGSFQDAPTVSHRGSGIIDVFVRGTDNKLYHKYWQSSNNTWSGWNDLGGTLTSGPTSVSRTTTSINIFAKGSSNELVHKNWNGSTWSSWDNLGGTLASAPTVASWGTTRLDVFYQNTSDELVQIAWNGSSWGSHSVLNAGCYARPGVVSWGNNRIDLLYRRNDGLLMLKTWDGMWHQRYFGGMSPLTVGAPVLSSHSSGSLNMFGRNSSGELVHKSYN